MLFQYKFIHRSTIEKNSGSACWFKWRQRASFCWTFAYPNNCSPTDVQHFSNFIHRNTIFSMVDYQISNFFRDGTRHCLQYRDAEMRMTFDYVILIPASRLVFQEKLSLPPIAHSFLLSITKAIILVRHSFSMKTLIFILNTSQFSRRYQNPTPRC